MATISSLLRDHVTLRVRSVDRVFLAGYVPRLACDGQLVRFLLDRVGGNIPSPAILGRIGRGYVEAVDRFAIDHRSCGFPRASARRTSRAPTYTPPSATVAAAWC